MNRLAIFDCDGTLVDSGHTIYVALEQALTEHGLVVPPPHICKRVIGLSLVEAVAELIPKEEPELHRQVAETYKLRFHALRAAGKVCEPLFDGIAELLQQLEGEGWLLAVATGKSDRGLRHCLEANGIRSHFMSLQTADRHPSKPHPSMALKAMADAGAEPQSTIILGDTRFDMGMAAAAGCFGIGVAWGYHEAEELLAGGAGAIAQSPAEVPKIVQLAIGTADAG
jgi:phosphoglycolate phosphatase